LAEGASILGLPYKRHKNGNRLRATVKFTAYSPQDNEIVAALFMGPESKSVHYSIQPVRAGSSASVTFTCDVDYLSDAQVNFEVRVGSRRPGELYINGDDTGAVTSNLKKTSFTIEELWDPGPLVPGSLAYVGTTLGESELARVQRVAGARCRKSRGGGSSNSKWPQLVLSSLENAVRWGLKSTRRHLFRR
jgi:hypothetical protein